MKEKKDRIEVLWQIMQALGGHDSAEDAFTEAMEIIRGEIGIGEMTVWLRDPEEARVVAIAHAGESSVAGYSVDPKDSVVGKVIATEKEIWASGEELNNYFPNGLDTVTGIRVFNCYLFPVRRSGETVGCLQAVNRSEGVYSEEEKATLRSFCGLAAMVADELGVHFPGGKNRNVILSLRNVVKEFQTGAGLRQILKGIDLDIYENEFLVILGESGCGKSTLLNIIGGIDSLTRGKMFAGGKDLTELPEEELSRYRRDVIGFVFQSYNLMPNLTALENIEFIAENTPGHGDPEDALAMVGLSDRADRYPSMLSGGQQQRVAIARAIVKQPKIILADEPTGALDFATGKEVLRVIEKLVHEKKTTVVMVTHNREIARMANRVIRMRDGRIGSVQENAWPRSAEELVW
ncbi:MAG: ATP-binding cassette domain-containing protein [Oscillospiraceae bacterium]|nr:ATP-binding cassette domain-containing protein [Oscillospiraceae bacterium]